MDLSDVGTIAVVGGIIGDTAKRLTVALGHECEVDGWREGMFWTGLFALFLWAFRRLGA